MDWDRNASILWLDRDAGYPSAEDFSNDSRAVKWGYAIEGLTDIYGRQDDPVPPTTLPWMLWDDGTIFTPGQIGAVRPVYEEEVLLRGGAFGKSGLEATRAFA